MERLLSLLGLLLNAQRPLAALPQEARLVGGVRGYTTSAVRLASAKPTRLSDGERQKLLPALKNLSAAKSGRDGIERHFGVCLICSGVQLYDASGAARREGRSSPRVVKRVHKGSILLSTHHRDGLNKRDTDLATKIDQAFLDFK